MSADNLVLKSQFFGDSRYLTVSCQTVQIMEAFLNKKYKLVRYDERFDKFLKVLGKQ